MKRIAIFLAFFVLGIQILVAQTVQITGTVTSKDDGQPLPGASVFVSGTSIGVVTDIYGKYSLTVPSGDHTLMVSFVGMKTTSVVIAGQQIINVALEADNVGLDEVVVVAYGTVRKEANTGSIGVVKEDAIKDVPETSIDKILSGKVAGLTVSSASGQPGSNSQVRVRGISSINAGNDPLYVVDGIPVMQGDQSYFTNSGNALSSINPNDIESISVLKDAAAASVYGSRAANGVILITTKAGKTGKTTFNVRSSFGIDQMANDNGFGVLSPTQYVKYWRDAITNSGIDPDNPSSTYYMPYSVLQGKTTNWMDELTKKGKIYSIEFNAQGGNEKTKAFFSGSYDKNEGVFNGIDLERFQFRTNVDHQINDKLKIFSKINASHTKTNDISMQSLYYVNPMFAGMALSPLTTVRNSDGSYNLSDFGYWSNTNPAASAEYDKQWEKQYRFLGSMGLEWKIIEPLTFKTINAFEFTDGEGVRYWSDEADPLTDKSTLQSSRTFYRQMTTSNTLDFRKLFNKHSLQLTAGQEATSYYTNSYYISSPDINPQIPYPNSGSAATDQADYDQGEFSLLSYFGILYYNLDNKYFLQGSIRTDGCSRFGKNNRWGTFYSVSASWNIAKESFMSSVSYVDLLKLRTSYGVNGNYNIKFYDQYGLYDQMQYNGVVGMTPSQVANPNLGWELNKETNIALDFGILNRLTGTIEYYYRKTEDMLLDYPLSLTSGFETVKTNIGQVDNRGYEILLNYNAIKGNDLKWDLGFNFSHNSSKIVNLGKDQQIVDADNTRIVHKVGEHLNSFYLYDYAGVNPANGDALWYDADGKMTNKRADARKVIAGSPEAKFTGGFNTQISYKGISLDAYFEFKLGNKVLLEENRYFNSDGYWWYKNQFNTALDYWKKPGDVTRNPKPVLNNSSNSNSYTSTRWLQNGDFLRIKNITLSYSLPKKLLAPLKLSTLRIYSSAVNLYTFHDVDAFDPERGEDGTGFGIYPQTKKIIFGLELSF